MVDEMRVTVVATGLGEDLPVAMSPPEVEIKPVRLISEAATEKDEDVDYTSLEIPTNIRRNPKPVNEYAKSSSNKDMEYLDIPAFLRRQAD
jgi:cell division protein FtsZ